MSSTGPVTRAGEGAPGRSTTAPRPHLTFVLAGETFAMEIHRVREVLEIGSVTRVPRSSPFMRGVISLRGVVVPVMDLRDKLGLGATETTIDTCIIIVEITIDGREHTMGVMADSVREVVELSPDEVDAVQQLGVLVDRGYLAGMARSEERFTMILDIDEVFTKREIVEARSSRDDTAATVTSASLS